MGSAVARGREGNPEWVLKCVVLRAGPLAAEHPPVTAASFCSVLGLDGARQPFRSRTHAPQVLQAVLGHALHSGFSGSEGFAAGLLFGREVPGKCISFLLSPRLLLMLPVGLCQVCPGLHLKGLRTSAAAVPDVG